MDFSNLAGCSDDGSWPGGPACPADLEGDLCEIEAVEASSGAQWPRRLPTERREVGD